MAYTKLLTQPFQFGSLKKESNIRPNRIFTADRRIILYRVGRIKEEKLKEVIERIIQILRA